MREGEDKTVDIPELNVNNPALAKGFEKIARLEQGKLNKFDEKTAAEQNKLKLLQDLKGKFQKIRDSIQPFRTPADFRDLKGTSSNENLVKFTAIDKAVAQPGTYELEVVNLANTNSVMTTGLPDRDKSEVGVGYISFKDYEGNSHDVYINQSNNTLDGVAQTINDANVGVRANVVNDGTDAENCWRVVLSGDGTGWKHDYEWPEFYFTGGDVDFDIYKIREAKSAAIKFNGQPLYVDENSVKNLLPGVNFDLKNAKPGETVKLDVAPDFEKIEGKAQAFVDSVNAVLQFIQNQNALTSDSRKDPTKALGGDVGLQTIESRLRTVLTSTEAELEDSNIHGFHDLGMVFNRSGTLDFDAKKFQKTLEDHFQEVSTLFAGKDGSSGAASQIMALVDGITRTGDGMLTMRESNSKDKIKKIETDKERATHMAEARLQRVREQFGRADQAFESMQQMKGALPQAGGQG